MPPKLALLLGTAFVLWLLHRDMSWRRLPSPALWIPGLWLSICSSQAPAYWLSMMGLGGGASRLEGSPINTVFNGSLFLVAILVLRGRNFSWGEFFSANKALSLIFAFFLCSILWSPLPVPTLKAVIQNFGCVLTGLVILTEENPAISLRILFARVSYVMFPLSVVFIKYFPHIGHTVSSVSGTHMLSGVAGHKNSLGEMAMVLCLVLLWDLMETRNQKTSPQVKPERWARLISLTIGLYLLVISLSATALICFLIGLVIFFFGKRLARNKNPRKLLMVGVMILACFLIFEQTFEITNKISESLDRGSGMSGRTDIWRVIMEKDTNYLVGWGFRGFWDSSDGLSVSEELGTNRFVTAHNGYLEIYVKGGLVGLFLLRWFCTRMAKLRNLMS